MDYQGELAQLEYRFLFGATQTGTLVRGTLQVDVSFPCTSEIAQFPPGQLFYSTSPDGQTWSAFLSVQAGHNEMSIQFTEGACHVQFRGARAMIDNLRVSPSTPGITLRASQNSTAGLISNGSAPSILHVDWQFGRDWNDGKSRATPSRRCRKRSTSPADGDIVVVWPGLYQEEIAFKGKAITVQSAADAAVITAPNGYAFSFYGAEGSKSILANFVIAGCGTGGIFCDSGALAHSPESDGYRQSSRNCRLRRCGPLHRQLHPLAKQQWTTVRREGISTGRSTIAASTRARAIRSRTKRRAISMPIQRSRTGVITSSRSGAAMCL